MASASTAELQEPDWERVAEAARSIETNYPAQMKLVIDLITEVDSRVGGGLKYSISDMLMRRFFPLINQLLDQIQSKQLSPQNVITDSNSIFRASSAISARIYQAVRSELDYDWDLIVRVQEIEIAAAEELTLQLPVIYCGIGGDGGEFCGENRNSEFENFQRQIMVKLFSFSPYH